MPSFVSMDDDGDSTVTVSPSTKILLEINVPSLLHVVDGKMYRPCIAINGLVPGPTLVVNEGQVVVANVINALITETISIHRHGMDQRNTPEPYTSTSVLIVQWNHSDTTSRQNLQAHSGTTHTE